MIQVNDTSIGKYYEFKIIYAYNLGHKNNINSKFVFPIYNKYGFKYNCHEYNDFEIELWTGLYDKNGKKIYDGDIIKYNKYKLKVEFINSEFIVKGYGNGGFFCLLSNMFNENGYSHIEVIGNIHEKKL
ncbi:hypothetical protein YZ31_07535 [Campylobacter lari]|nr:hypothetical protein [Campylobacter lari]